LGWLSGTLNPMNHNSAYRSRRFTNWFPLGLTYAAFYMGRYNVHVANDTIRDSLSLSKEEFGWILSAGFWTYALSVIFNGPLADRIGGRKAILIGALGTTVLNLIIGLLFMNGWQTKVILGMSLLYSVSSYFQSFGALSVVKVNAAWFHVRERGIFGGIFGIMISCGYLLAMGVGGWILASLDWWWVFIIPSGCIAAMLIVDYFVVRDTPEQAGHPRLRTDDASESDRGAIDFAYLAKRVFTNPVIVTIAVAEFCTGWVRQGLLGWFTSFLKEEHGIAAGTTWHTVAAIGITVGGILGGLICGYLSDRVFQSRRPPVAFIFYLAQVVSLLALGAVGQPEVAAILVGFSCIWIFGVHGMLSGTASMDFGGKRAAATAAGMLDGCQYLASGFTGFAMGKLLDEYGWGVWTYSIVPFSVIGAILMLRIWNESPLKARKGEEPPRSSEEPQIPLHAKADSSGT
jgi:OPA family glycerol-3-phosphate transporter-like MFS transporter